MEETETIDVEETESVDANPVFVLVEEGTDDSSDDSLTRGEKLAASTAGALALFGTAVGGRWLWRKMSVKIDGKLIDWGNKAAARTDRREPDVVIDEESKKDPKK